MKPPAAQCGHPRKSGMDRKSESRVKMSHFCVTDGMRRSTSSASSDRIGVEHTGHFSFGVLLVDDLLPAAIDERVADADTDACPPPPPPVAMPPPPPPSRSERFHPRTQFEQTVHPQYLQNIV